MYKVFDLWNDFLSFIALVVLVVLIYVSIKYHSNLDDESEIEVKNLRKKWLKYLAVSFLALCLVDYILLSIQTYVAPDIALLFELVKQLKN